VIGRGPFVAGSVDLAAVDLGGETTYDPALRGDSLGPTMPDGFRADRHVRAVGEGADDFARAVEGVRAWAPHLLGPRIAVHPSAPPALGDRFVQHIRLGPLSVLAALEVVAVVEEPRRYALAFGTLPLHPESGEEAFVVSHDEDDVVRFRVVAFSRFRHPLTKLGAPVTRGLQVTTQRRYLDGLERHVSRE
jgi:uncharacterized protein (UPF0548 family)